MIPVKTIDTKPTLEDFKKTVGDYLSWEVSNILKQKGDVIMEREKAVELLKKYNKEEFHIRHALTVEAVMRYFAKQKGYDEDFWGIVRFIA